MILIALAFLLLFSPRFILFMMWLFQSSRLDAFSTLWWPFIGFLFLPFTTLMYMLVWSVSNGISFIGWLLVGFAFLIDMGSYGAGARGKRVHKPRNINQEPKSVENIND